jgi:topoisomerase-4 subunit A
LSSSFTPPAGAAFVGVALGAEEDWVLLGSSAGYGFVARLGELFAKNKAGKAVLSVGSARALPPVPIGDLETDLLAAVTDAGRLLVFPVSELPQLARGKGVKILNIPRGKAEAESLAHLVVVPDHGTLRIHSGKRYVSFKGAELAPFTGARASRGTKLPRGYQSVSRVELL